MVTILMMPAKLASPGLLTIKIFQNKGYDVIIPDYDVANKDLTWKTAFFEGWSWFKFSSFGLVLGMTLRFYASVAKALKLKVRNFGGLILTFVEVTGEKLDSVKWINLVIFLGDTLMNVEKNN